MASILDGLLVYRQYLENVRSSVKNYDLSELESKNFMDIVERVNQIEDLAYIDVVLQNAGLNLSFIGDRKFLDEKVVLQSKLTDVLYKGRDMDETMRAAISDYMSIFMLEEDSIIDEINEISQSVSSVTVENFPKSSSKYYSAKEIVEKNQDTLRSLFGALAEMDKKLSTPEPEQTDFVEEYFDEDMPDDDLVLDGSDIRELISDEVENTENKKISKKEDKVTLSTSKLEKEEEVVIEEDKELYSKSNDFDDEDDFKGEVDFKDEDDLEVSDGLDEQEEIEFDSEDFGKMKSELDEIEYKSDVDDFDDFDDFDSEDEEEEEEEDADFDTSFLDDDDISDNSSDDSYSERFEYRENKYFDDEDESDNSEIEDEDDFETFESRRRNRDNFRKKDFNKFLDSDEIKDETDSLLLDDLMDEEDRYFDDTDPIERSAFEEATNYFLTGKSSVYGKDDLSKLYKSKEKIVQSDDVSNADDAVAKMVLAVADGIIKLPKITGNLFRKAKTSGRKMRENMIVEDDDDNG